MDRLFASILIYLYKFFIGVGPLILVCVLTLITSIYYWKYPKRLGVWLKKATNFLWIFLFLTVIFFIFAVILVINNGSAFGDAIVKSGRLETVIGYALANSTVTFLFVVSFSYLIRRLQKKFRQFSAEDGLAAALAFSIAGLGNLNIALKIVFNPVSYLIILFVSLLLTILLAFIAGFVVMALSRNKKRLIIGPMLIYAAFVVYLFGFNFVNTNLGSLIIDR